MSRFLKNKIETEEFGFSTANGIYTPDEISEIATFISNLNTSNPIFRKSEDLFAIRQFVKEFPAIKNLIFNENLKELLQTVGGENYNIVKSIYFDKPENSNWFVAYHQDLTISVDRKIELEGFTSWTSKHNQFAVQPPIEILENSITLRIHLDDTDENNGALKVIATSHRKQIFRPETIDFNIEKEVSCAVLSGGVMIMKPLLLHGSNRTSNNKRRRVIHLEFSDLNLPEELNWAEFSKL